MARVLAGMGIEAAVITVEDPAAEIGKMYLRDPLELAGDRGLGILHGGGVLLRRHLQDVGALQRVQTGGAEVFHHPGPNDRRVHLREAIQHLQRAALVPGCWAGTRTSPGAGHTRHGHARHRQRPEQARSEAHGRDDVFLLRDRIRAPPDPTSPRFPPSPAHRCARCPWSGSASAASWRSRRRA